MVTNNASNEPTAASGKVLQGQGVGIKNNFSTATYPSVATTTGTILRADGTNWVASTSTFADTYTASNLLYSNGANTVTGLATANSAILATNSSGVPSITTASGNWLNTSRCAFLAILPSNENNVTGNGAQFTLGSTTALTEVFDQGSDFNTNGTFTAPVTGRYDLSAVFRIVGCAVATLSSGTINCSNRAFGMVEGRAASANDLGTSLSVLADMDAGDTATSRIVVSGEAGNTCDLGGNATNGNTYFSGYLAC